MFFLRPSASPRLLSLSSQRTIEQNQIKMARQHLLGRDIAILLAGMLIGSQLSTFIDFGVYTSSQNPSDGIRTQPTIAMGRNLGGSDTKSLDTAPDNQRCKLPQNITIDYAAVRAQNNSRLEQTKHLTFDRYERWYMGAAGREHYTLIHHLATKYGDGRHIVDIGTRYVSSSLAMASAGNEQCGPVSVWTFDLPKSRERGMAFRGKTEEEWYGEVAKTGLVGDIRFHNIDLMAVSDVRYKKYMDTWLILLDTAHLPETVPFEREFLARLISTTNFNGILVLDDIHLKQPNNGEMERWWKEIRENAARLNYTAYDVTAIGHSSGTGLVDFTGGKVKIIK